jgi:formylglycine-generating enzyme required for sulfatase activity
MTSYSDVCRVSARSQSIPNATLNFVGFRLAMDEESK